MSIILSVMVLAGTVFFLVCLRGFHQAMAHGRSGQLRAVQNFMRPVDGIATADNLSPEARIIPFPKGKAVFDPLHKTAITAVTRARRKFL